MRLELNILQQEIANQHHDKAIFLEGMASSGKTTAAVQRLSSLIEANVPAETITILVPQRTLALPYLRHLEEAQHPAGGQVRVTTLSGLSRQAVDLFWPIVAPDHGFANPDKDPTFLSLETSQYFMARVVEPLVESQGLFDTVTIDRNRLYSQLIDAMGKASVVGFPLEEVGERLKSSTADHEQRRIYDDVQRGVDAFRAYCLGHNLLDFSLQLELYLQRVWPLIEYQDMLWQQTRHIIVDNIEEDTPASHGVVRELLQRAGSGLIIYDSDAGYRRFLGADPISAATLKESCDIHVQMAGSFVLQPELEAFGTQIGISLNRGDGSQQRDPRASLSYDNYKYHPEMIHGVAERIASLVHDAGVEPGEIVVLAPFMSDALRFSLMNRLETHDVPVGSHRPSRSLREEPATLSLLTLAQLAHPEWKLFPTAFDVVYALIGSVEGLDLVRSQLLTHNAYVVKNRVGRLQPFDMLNATVQERITYVVGDRYDRLRNWIDDYRVFANDMEPLHLDHFFSRLFGEVLSQPGFGFHNDFDAAKVAAQLIESTRKFRRIITSCGATPQTRSLAQEYVEMVNQGIIADQFLRGWELQQENVVLLAPAYTFLMSNRPVGYQFWLNVGGRGWSERLYQPLTNPYVLSRQWPIGRIWRDADEQEVGLNALHRLTLGLVRRCRKAIFLGFSELGEQGYEQRGELLGAVQRMLRRLSDEGSNGF